MYLAKMTTAQAKDAFEKDPVNCDSRWESTDSTEHRGRWERTLWYRPIWRIMWRM